MKEQNQNQINYVPSQYTKSLQNYVRLEMNTISHYLAVIAHHSQYSSMFPVLKLMKNIAKTFMLNQIEVIFLAYLIAETKWNIHEKIIEANFENVKDIISIKIQNPQYKCLTLYLMICGYTVKFYLNQQISEILQEANKICYNFKSIFEVWAKTHATLTAKISPKTLNEVYIKLYDCSRIEQPDFNRMVDAIMQISPAYNPERLKSQPKKQKQAVISNIPDNIQRYQKSTWNNNRSSIVQIPIFSSSALMHMTTVNECHQPQSNINPFGKSQKPNSRYLEIMKSSVAGIQNFGIGDDGGNCQELNLGLQQGQSQQNIVFNNNINQQEGPLTSVITLSRGISLTERYLCQSVSQSFINYKDNSRN